jgi:hypothetical protein
VARLRAAEVRAAGLRLALEARLYETNPLYYEDAAEDLMKVVDQQERARRYAAASRRCATSGIAPSRAAAGPRRRSTASRPRPKS